MLTKWKVARIMLNDEAIKEIEKKLKKRTRIHLSFKKNQSTHSSPTRPGNKRTFEEYNHISESGNDSNGTDSSQDFENDLEAETEDTQAEMIDFDLYEKNQAKIKRMIEEFKMDISLRAQKIVMNEARIVLIQRELARRVRGSDVTKGSLERDIDLVSCSNVDRYLSVGALVPMLTSSGTGGNEEESSW